MTTIDGPTRRLGRHLKPIGRHWAPMRPSNYQRRHAWPRRPITGEDVGVWAGIIAGLLGVVILLSACATGVPPTGPTWSPAPSPDPAAMQAMDRVRQDADWVVITVRWEGQRSLRIKYVPGGESGVMAYPYKDARGEWHGYWAMPFPRAKGQMYDAWTDPTPIDGYTQCTIHGDGMIQDFMQVQEGPCIVDWIAP